MKYIVELSGDAMVNLINKGELNSIGNDTWRCTISKFRLKQLLNDNDCYLDEHLNIVDKDTSFGIWGRCYLVTMY